MDNLHKLIEMFEKRYGKFGADCLLLIAVLGVAAWAIHSFFEYLIFPAVRGYGDVIEYFHRGGQVHVSMGDVWVDVAQLAFALAVGLLSLRWLQNTRKRALAAAEFAEQSLAKAQDIIMQNIKRSETVVAECQAFTEKNHRKLDSWRDEAEQRWLKLIAKERELELKYPQAALPPTQEQPTLLLESSPHTHRE
jgi:hypothetical protein